MKLNEPLMGERIVIRNHKKIRFTVCDGYVVR